MPNEAGAGLPRRLMASGHRGRARAAAGSRDPGEMGADEPLQHEPPEDVPPGQELAEREAPGHEPPGHAYRERKPPQREPRERESLERQIRFVIEADRLKKIARQSRITDGTRRENSAEHSWHWP